MSRDPALTVAAADEEELCGIWSYIALDNPPAADRIWKRLTRVYEMLARQP